MEQQFAHYSKLLLAYLPRVTDMSGVLGVLGALCALALLLCLAGLPLLAVAGQSLAGSRGRSAYDKCARQLGYLGKRLGSVAILAGGVALAMQYRSFATLDMHALAALDIRTLAAGGHLLPLLAACCWLCVLLSALLNCLYTGLWRSQRPAAPRLHQLPGFLAALAAAAAVYAALLYLHARAVVPAASVPADVRALLLPEGEVFWAALSYASFAALGLAGGYGALWLLLRRAADDYGRDHYNLVIPWCAGWARNCWLLLWLFAAIRTGWRAARLHAATGGTLDGFAPLVPECAELAVLLVPGLLWLVISRSATPLRAKIATTLAPLWATGCILLLDMGV